MLACGRNARLLKNDLTHSDFKLLWRHKDSKAGLRPKHLAQAPIASKSLEPHAYCEDSSLWVSQEKLTQNSFQRGTTLKIVSWNIDLASPGPAERASAVMKHLKEHFGDAPESLVVMLQEVRHESLQAILENPWVRRNFAVSDVEAPQAMYKNILGESFLIEQSEWETYSYFTIMLVPKNMSILNCSRIPFVTKMARDALVVDVPISTNNESTQSSESLRLCTTHLESLWDAGLYRLGQLAVISRLLKESSVSGHRFVGGLVGGDMNAMNKLEHELHKAPDVDLLDAWNDVPPQDPLVLNPFKRDLTDGRGRGNTFGYQSSSAKRNGGRYDKFFYTGSLQTVTLTETEDIAGRIGRLGIGLKTEVEAWEWCPMIGGKPVFKGDGKRYVSQIQAANMQSWNPGVDLKKVKISHWVSDHFGISVGIKIV